MSSLQRLIFFSGALWYKRLWHKFKVISIRLREILSSRAENCEISFLQTAENRHGRVKIKRNYTFVFWNMLPHKMVCMCVCVCVCACPTQAYSHSIIVDYNHLSIICKCLHLYPSLFSVPPVLPRSASCRTFICLDFERSSFLNNFIDTCFCGYGVITTWSLFYESVL